jgi:DNA-binding IclR family transcriptional regulator
MLELRNIRCAEERVLQHLRLSLPIGGDTVVFTRPLTHVAAEIGLRHEAYYRCLASLNDKGAIKRVGRSFRVRPSRD